MGARPIVALSPSVSVFSPRRAPSVSLPLGGKDGAQQLQASRLLAWQPREESVSFPVIPAQAHDLPFIVSDWPRRDDRPVSEPITAAKGLLRPCWPRDFAHLD